MRLLRLWKIFTKPKGITWCDIHLVFTVDGVERFKDSLRVNADFLDAVLHASRHPWLPRAAQGVGVLRWDLLLAIEQLHRDATWEVRDGQLFPLPT
jgi:hypothetical protein